MTTNPYTPEICYSCPRGLDSEECGCDPSECLTDLEGERADQERDRREDR